MTTTLTVSLDELFDQKRNAINFAKLFELPQGYGLSESTSLVPVRTRPHPVTAPSLERSYASSGIQAVLPSRRFLTRVKTKPARAIFPRRKTFEVNAVAGSLTGFGTNANFQNEGDLEITIPAGVRFVNVATFKAMAGRAESDTVLKRVGSRWTPLDDDTLIDLADGSQEYKVGPIQVYS